MRIIVEGVDGSGKTTLINKIAEMTGWPIIKFSAPKTNNPYKEWQEYYIETNKKYIGDNVILDRCWLSEIIYGPIKGRLKITREQIKFFKDKTKNDFYIITRPSEEFIKNSFDNRGENYITLKEAIDINRKYFEFANNNRLGKIQYFYHVDFYKNCEEYINKFINQIIGKEK